MKAIKLSAVITSIRAKVDRSLGLTLATPEFTNDEKVEVMNLQNVPIELLIKPTDEIPKELLEINTEIEGKTPSQRMRAVIYILWKQLGEPGQYETYYRDKMERIINQLKDKIVD